MVILSRDELKQHQMSLNLSLSDLKKHVFLEMRDKDRLSIALKDVDYVVHAAALKQVPAGEYNPFEL